MAMEDTQFIGLIDLIDDFPIEIPIPSGFPRLPRLMTGGYRHFQSFPVTPAEMLTHPS